MSKESIWQWVIMVAKHAMSEAEQGEEGIL